MRVAAIFAFILACVVFSMPGIPSAEEGGKLLKVVVLSRHGVRSPTQNEKTLALWSGKTWPTWPVPKGDLTQRGSRLVTAMWRDLRTRLARYKLLPDNACPPPGAIFVRADVDERTRATARAILDGAAPECSFGFAVLDAKIDPLFHPVKSGLYRFNAISAATDVLTMTDGGLEDLQEDFAGTLDLLANITGPMSGQICSRFTMSPSCRLPDLPNAVSVSADGANIRLVGGLSVASSLAEIFLLEYAQWPGVDAGWGAVNGTILSQILPVHSKVFDVINRAPIVAWARGASLLREMDAALFNEHPDSRANEAKLVIFVGHDTNIANIGALMGITWQVSGFPLNGIPPGSAIFFELWERHGRRYVMVRYYSQTPKVLHAPFSDETAAIRSANGRPGNVMADDAHAPVAALVSSPPVVGQARFDTASFRRRVQDSTEGAPIAPPQSPPLDFNRNFAR